MESTDSYNTINSPSKEVLFKDKNSKFIGYSFPINNELEVKNTIERLKKKHFGAVHFCYAYQIGVDIKQYRINDDGEPSNSAGMPIYGQIQSFDVTNILIVIVRYFGGTKLGVSGLINAYKTAAQMSLEASDIVEKTINIHFEISFEYKNMNKVMRIIKEKKLQIINQEMTGNCKIEIATRKKNAEIIFDIFNTLFEVSVKKL